ncbi:MAG: barstar family protein [Burkholderiales bacterium]|nr:barstar family protein [Burkholderiales bacterium]
MKPPAFSVKLNGVYRAPVDRAPLRAAAAGLRWFAADLRDAGSGRAVCGALAGALDYPGSFGENWDALNDVLQDLSWLKASGCVLQLDGVASLAPGVRDTLLEILASAAAFWKRRGREFIVLADDDSLPALPQR